MIVKVTSHAAADGQVGPIDILVEKLAADDDAGVRQWAASELGKMGGDRATEALAEALRRDRSPDVRRRAIWALAASEDLRALKPLLGVLRWNEYFDTRRWAVSAVGRLAGPTALEPLVLALRTDTHWIVRYEAALTLATLRDARALEALAERMEEDEEPTVRHTAEAAIRALAEAPSPELVFQLEWLLAEGASGRARATAASALAACGGERAFLALVAALRDPDETVRAAGADGLGEALAVGMTGAKEWLLDALEDRSDLVRRAARRALAAASAARC